MVSTEADRIALQDVILRYAAGIDDRDFELYRTCFMPDVSVYGMRETPVHGVEPWVEFVHQALAPYRTTQHMLGPQLATIDGDKAMTRTDLQALHCFREYPDRTFIFWGTYRSDMVRTDAGWKIQRHELIRRFTRTADRLAE